MKKIVCVLLVAVLILAGCGPRPKYKATEQHIKYGQKALEIADAYLDFDLSLEDAKKKIDDLYDAEESLPKPSKEEELGCIAIEGDVFSLNSAFFHADLRAAGLKGIASAESADILKARNKLAEDLGVKAR